MKVKDIMVGNVVTVGPDDTFYDTVELLSQKKISGAPVATGKKPLGMVSESDLMKYISKKDLISMIESDKKETMDVGSVKAREIMSKEIVSVKPGDDVSKVIKLMSDKDINRLVVIDDDKLVGIVTRADVLSVVSEYLMNHPSTRGKQAQGQEPALETSIDRLLALVRERSSIRFSEAAKKLEVTDSRIEEWGKILECNKLVALHYPPFGAPSIRIIKEKYGKKAKSSSQ